MTVTAQVQITLDVEAHSSWGDSTTMDQIYRQAVADALGHISSLIRDGALKATIVGKPLVTSVMVEHPRR